MRYPILLVYSVLCVFTTLTAQSEPRRSNVYKDIENSREFWDMSAQRLKRTNNSTRLNYPAEPYLTPGTNMYLIFDDPKRAEEVLFRWISPSGTDYKIGELMRSPKISHIQFETDYEERTTGRRFKVEVFVPHPAFYPMVESGMLKEYADAITPPHASESAEVNLAGASRTIWYLERSCSIALEAENKVLVHVTALGECNPIEPVRRFIQSLNLRRLNHELQSPAEAAG